MSWDVVALVAIAVNVGCGVWHWRMAHRYFRARQLLEELCWSAWLIRRPELWRAYMDTIGRWQVDQLRRGRRG